VNKQSTGEPDVPLLPHVLADRYETGRELGRGGMARVYLARDRKHGRDVAIKVLRPELSASLGFGRFLREIEIAARLRHPNIVPLYDSGEVGGLLYFVMPFEEGRSLRQRLHEGGPLPISEAMSVLRDVARALAYAHDHSVVHRDVKPDNVMLTGDAAVVTDFGIAKAVSAALTDSGGMTLTQAGSVMGTPAYMAPEQAMGDPATDHRADIYSFGCLAYEVLTGRPPFPEPTSHQVVAAHLSRAPRAVTELRAEVPPSLADLVAHCLAKLPERRPQNVRDVLIALDGLTTTGSVARPGTPLARIPRRALRWGAVAVALALLAFVGYRVSQTPIIGAPLTLSVLPLGNTSGDTAAEYLTDGLPDEIAASLTRVPGIQIRSRSGARFYRGQLDVDVADAGARLGADYIMTGMVRRVTGRWILSADLSRATDRTSIWGENFTINPDQQAVAVETITSSLLASLRHQFPKSFAGASPVVAAAAQTRNPEAYRLYLRGQERLSRRGLSVRASAEHFRQAIREDSLFAKAYSGLSMSVALFPNFQGVPSSAINDEVVAAARHALALDSSLAQPHIALGLAHQFAYRWEDAAAEFQTAIKLDPRDVEARVQYARNLLYRLRNSEALTQLRAARVEDPASALVLSWMSAAYMLDGQLDSALVESARAFENDSSNFSTINWRVRILLQAKRGEEARRLVDRVSQLPGATAGYVYAKSGDHSGARRILARLDGLSPQPGLAQMERAATYLGLGDTAKALAALDRATEIGEIWTSVWPVSDPMFDPVRGSAHFAAILRKVGLPENAAGIRRRP